FRLERELGELGQSVGDAFSRREALRKLPQDAGRHRNVAFRDLDPGGLGEGAQDGQQRIGGEPRRFVSERVDDLGVCHSEGSLGSGAEKVAIIYPPQSLFGWISTTCVATSTGRKARALFPPDCAKSRSFYNHQREE